MLFLPLSPLPKDHVVRPSLETQSVCALPHATWPTLLTSLTKVGTFLLLLSPQPSRENIQFKSYSTHRYSLLSFIGSAVGPHASLDNPINRYFNFLDQYSSYAHIVFHMSVGQSVICLKWTLAAGEKSTKYIHYLHVIKKLYN